MAAQQSPFTFITAADMSRYEQIFRQTVPSLQQRIDGPTARKILMQSSLPNQQLATIWDLADVNKQGSLTFAEFALAMYLAQTSLSGKPLPPTLPDSVRTEVLRANQVYTQQQQHMPAYDAIANNSALMLTSGQQQHPQGSVGIAGGVYQQPSMTRPTPAAPYPVNQPSMAGAGPSFGHSQQLAPPYSGNSEHLPLQSSGPAHPTMPSYQPAPTMGSMGSAPLNFQQPQFSHATTDALASASHWIMTAQEKEKYHGIFRQYDHANTGYLAGDQARELFMQSGLPQRDLMKVWSLADFQNHGKLNLDEFSVAMHLIFKKLHGVPIPDQLPDTLVPKSTRDLSDSISQLKGSIIADAVSKKTQPGGSSAHPMSSSFLLESDPVLASAYAALGATDLAPSASSEANSSVSSSMASRRRRDQDDAPLYVSKNRYKSKFNTSNPAKALTASDLERLRKQIREKRYVLDALQERLRSKTAGANAGSSTQIAELKQRVQACHQSLMGEPDSLAVSVRRVKLREDLEAIVSKRTMLQKDLQSVLYSLPARVSEAHTLVQQWSEQAKEAARRRDVQANPGSSGQSPGTSASGAFPGSGDVSQRAAALIAERMQRITGQNMAASPSSPASMSSPGSLGGAGQLQTDLTDIDREQAQMEARLTDIEATYRRWRDYINDQERQQRQDPKSQAWPSPYDLEGLLKITRAARAEQEKWELTVGVRSEEVRQLIEELAVQFPMRAPASSFSTLYRRELPVSEPKSNYTSPSPTASIPSLDRGYNAAPSPIVSAPVPKGVPASRTESPTASSPSSRHAIHERTRQLRERFEKLTSAPETSSPSPSLRMDYSAPYVTQNSGSALSQQGLVSNRPSSPFGAASGTGWPESSPVVLEQPSITFAEERDAISQATRRARDAAQQRQQQRHSPTVRSPSKADHAPTTEAPSAAWDVSPRPPVVVATPSAAAPETDSGHQDQWRQAFSSGLEKDWDESSSSLGFTSDEDEGRIDTARTTSQSTGAPVALEYAPLHEPGTSGASTALMLHPDRVVTETTPAALDHPLADAAYGRSVEPAPTYSNVWKRDYDFDYDSDSSIVQEGGLSALLAKMITNKLHAMEAHGAADEPPPPPLPSYTTTAVPESDHSDNDQQLQPTAADQHQMPKESEVGVDAPPPPPPLPGQSIEIEPPKAASVTPSMRSVLQQDSETTSQYSTANEDEPATVPSVTHNPFAQLMSPATGATQSPSVASETAPSAVTGGDEGLPAVSQEASRLFAKTNINTTAAFDDVFAVPEGSGAADESAQAVVSSGSGSHNPFAKTVQGTAAAGTTTSSSSEGNDWQLVDRADAGVSGPPEASSNSGRVSDMATPVVLYKAIYNFDGNSPDDLKFTSGEIIAVPATTHWDEAWWQGWFQRDPAQRGYFPNIYVQRVEGDAAAGGSGDRTLTGIRQPAHMIYGYEAQHSDELTVTANEAVMILDRSDTDWWRIENQAKQAGIVPSAYVMADNDDDGAAGGGSDPTKASL
ncbi:actin organization and endocytosis protein [Dimargaris verticillata]|uniref:Actin organization and endocytosis protein n=1 Tax=Dimargaris verticillata TaxID=2761393 RepID=A0A9W8AXU6_9FUNG|nr:actin organization and endocytosis protein [Dimargaris verticillata]